MSTATMNLRQRKAEGSGNMYVIFVSGPYRSNSEITKVTNIQNAEGEALKLWRQGFAVICPHKNSENFDGLNETSDDMFRQGYLEILSRCDAIYMLKGWEKSVGATAELDKAVELKLRIIYEH